MFASGCLKESSGKVSKLDIGTEIYPCTDVKEKITLDKVIQDRKTLFKAIVIGARDQILC